MKTFKQIYESTKIVSIRKDYIDGSDQDAGMKIIKKYGAKAVDQTDKSVEIEVPTAKADAFARDMEKLLGRGATY